MKVKFLTTCEIEVFATIDDALDDKEPTTKIIQKGEIIEFTLLEPPLRFISDIGLVDSETEVNVMFSDKSVSFGLSKKWYS